MRNGGLITAAVLSALCASSGFGAAASAKDWPQWRGPLMTGEAPEADPPVKWSETENIKWKIQLPGEGHATPIIVGNQLFIQAAVPAAKKAASLDLPALAPQVAGLLQAEQPPQQPGQGEGRPRRPGGGGGRGFGGGAKPTEPFEFTLISIDRANGNILWKKAAREALPHEPRHATGSFASPSAASDGEHVYAFYGSQGLYCYDLKGNLKWSKDLGDMRIKNEFGEGASPALHGNLVIVNWDHEGDDFLVALDKRTGDEAWRTPRNEMTSWTTPLVVEHDGKAQVIIATTSKVISYDAATGKQIWEHAGLTQNAIPTPVASKGVVYATSGFRGAALYAIKLGKTGDLTDTDAVLWKHTRSTPYVPSPLLVGNRLYFLAGNNAMLSIFDVSTGKALVDAERLQGLGGIYASPIAAAGRIYIASQNGATLVLKDSDKVEVLATNTLDDRFDASPVAAGKELYLRGAKNLYSIAEK